MAETNQFSSAIEALFKGMEGFVTTKTVVGDPIQVNGAILLPLVDISFACGAGASEKEGKGKQGAGGGLGGKITPSAVLVIQDGSTRLVSVKSQDTVTRVLDMVPDLVNRFTKPSPKETVTDEEVREAVKREEK